MNRLPRFLACLLLSCAIVMPYSSDSAMMVSVRYPASDAVLMNPFVGNAVWARSKPAHEQPFTLVYVDLVWAAFEPEQGTYDFESFEEENQFALWRAQGKRVIFRFVMDVPTAKRHRDIPEWLYSQTGKDGDAYQVKYGRGYSPNYENPILIDAHARAIAALGLRYSKDPLIAFIEIGSLGHWGEWHVHGDIGEMPPKDVREKYAEHYIEAFPNTMLLMRRPYTIAAKRGMGLFNDTAGEPNSTRRWLSWIEHGTVDSLNDGGVDLASMPDAWRSAPIGGELATDMEHEELLGPLLTQTLELFKQSHTSWIGPGSFSDVPRAGELQGALNQVLNTIGYRLRVDSCTVEEVSDGMLRLTLVWKNDGAAPFYFDWQPALSIEGADGKRRIYPLAMRLIDVQPGLDCSVSLTLTPDMLPEGAYTVWAGILDPRTEQAGVALAMASNEIDLWYELLNIGLQQ